MDILIDSSDDPEGWLRDLGDALPRARVRLWTPGDETPADYAMVWKPHAAALRGRTALRAIFNLGAGVDAILALEREMPGTLPPGVPLVRLEDAGMAAQMSDYALYALLRHMRRFRDYAALQSEGRWKPLQPCAKADFPVAVLGLGQLGAHVADAVARLGFPTRGFSRTPRTIAGVTCHHGGDGLPQCARGARALINLLPDTPDTRGILNHALFSMLADDAIIINMGRGSHLVDADLLRAIEDGKVGAAMLDVFHAEPLPADHPFWRHPRVEITPHVAALTLRAEAIAQIAAKIAALEAGRPVGGIVDLARGY